MTLADATARELALTPHRSFAVAAPAGSGKTELLTQRVLKLLAIVEEPEEILCMTFTRKAAGEMQQRILQALTEAASNSATDETNYPGKDNSHQQLTNDLAKNVLARDKERHWQLLNNPNRLRIQTIDGFCLNLAQQLAIESRFGDYSEPMDDPTPLYREAITTLLLPALERQNTHENPLGLAVSTLLQHLDNDLNKFEQLLINLLSKREQWLGQLYQSRGARDYLESFLNQVIEETLAKATKLLAPFGSDLALLADYAAKQLPASKQHSAIKLCLGMTSLPAANATDFPQCQEQWLGLCELLLTGKDEWRKRLDKNGGFPTETIDGDKSQAKVQKETMTKVITELQNIPGLLDVLTDIRYLPPTKYGDDQWQVLDALTLLLPALSASLSLSFQQQKVCDFTEVTLAALRALGSEEEPTDLALKLDYQINHILTDEFQDTSSVQFDLLRRLTAGWQLNDGRSLFIVGDAMQSLYGFRNANVGLFLEARSMPLGNIQLEPLDLQVNFRSQAAIIDWVNNAFTQVFPPCDNISRGAVSYSSATAHHPALPADAVTVDAFIDYPNLKAEAEHVAELVSKARQHDPEGSIAILVRNRTHLTDILETLRQVGHRWQATDIDPLGKRMPVIDLMSLTRALLSPADRIAWLSILRTPWCGLNLNDLFLLANYIPTKNKLEEEGQPEQGQTSATGRYPPLLLNIFNHQLIPGISTSGQQILNRVSHQLKQTWDQRYRKPLRSWIEGVWFSLGGAAALRSETEFSQCQQYLDLLEQHESCGTLEDWSSFEKAVQSLYAKPDILADPNLHVMTIHKAKGLEFDTVIIPGLNRKPRSDDKQLILWQERVGQYGQNQLIIGPLERTGQETDPLFRYLQREQKLKGQLEKARVLYVGCTRAIKKLHLTYSIGKDKKPTAHSLLESLFPALDSANAEQNGTQSYSFQSHYFQIDDVEAVQTGLEKTVPSLNHIYRLPSDWKFNEDTRSVTNSIENTQPATNSVTQHKNNEHKSLKENLSALNTISRHTGTVLHRVLRQIVLDGIENWTVNTIQERLPFWKTQLQQLGVTALDAPLSLIQKAVNNCLKDETARWLLNNQHQNSFCEYSIGYIGTNNQPKTAVIDRCFITDDTQWIIDYKTAEPTEGESKANFVQREVNLYREQLEHYAKLFEQLGNRPIKTALYFPLICHLAII